MAKPESGAVMAGNETVFQAARADLFGATPPTHTLSLSGLLSTHLLL